MASSTVQCETGFEWAFNSLGQSPCLIAAYLAGACNGGLFSVPPLTGDQVYTGPTPEQANSCRCSSVFYSLTSACGACQGHEFEPWAGYNTNCTSVSDGSFPENIPPGTAVPDYAYQNIPASGTFDLNAASTDTGPESVAPSKPTGTGSSGSTGKSKSKVGPIVGGVVGGVVGLVLVTIVIFLIWRRRSRATTRAPTQPNFVINGDPMTPPPMGYASPVNGHFSTPPAAKLYNPSDPSTFPSSPATSAGYSTQPGTEPLIQHAHTGMSYETGHQSQYQQSQYSGVPEV